MKKLLVILISVCFLFSFAVAVHAEEKNIAKQYTVETPDFIVEDLGSVRVLESTVKVETLSWTLNEIDMCIDMQNSRMDLIQRNLDYLNKLRKNVEMNPKEVKWREPGATTL